MRLDVVDVKLGDGTPDFPIGAVSYKLLVSRDNLLIATIPMLVLNPTGANLRAANKKAILGDLRLRVHHAVDRQSQDLENG